MALPRILSTDAAGFLRQSPAPEFASLRGQPRTVAAAALEDKPLPLGETISGDCLEIQAEFSSKTATAVGLRVRGGTEISFNPRDGMLTVGKVRQLLGTGLPVRLRIFLDKRVMEVYANDGAAAIFTTVDAGPNDPRIEAFAKGGVARLESLTAWPLEPARFSLERFKA